MLIEILGKCPQIKVLDYLLANPFESYTKQQIAIGAEISRSTLDKFIDKLLENKILILKNSKYELNFNSEIVKKLDALQEYLAKKELEKQSSYETEEFIKYSDEDYSYKADFYDRTTYDNESLEDRYTSTVYYLTDEMMRDLGTGGSI